MACAFERVDPRPAERGATVGQDLDGDRYALLLVDAQRLPPGADSSVYSTSHDIGISISSAF